jgi:hypothetical protein
MTRTNKEKLSVYAHNYYKRNKDKIDLMQKDRNIKYPENRKTINRVSRLKYTYNITIDEYNSLFLNQNGRCKICGIHQSELTIPLCIDHNHNTGKIRGLLCRKCNTGIGLLGDNKDRLFRAFSYLEETE